MDLVTRILRNVPVLGWFIKDAMDGSATCKICFVANLVMLWLLAIYFFGYPAIIIPALCAVPVVFLTFIHITAGDFFSKQR